MHGLAPRTVVIVLLSVLLYLSQSDNSDLVPSASRAHASDRPNQARAFLDDNDGWRQTIQCITTPCIGGMGVLLSQPDRGDGWFRVSDSAAFLGSYHWAYRMTFWEGYEGLNSFAIMAPGTQLDHDGRYQVNVQIPRVSPSQPLTEQAHYIVFTGERSFPVNVNQAQARGGWISLGEFDIVHAGTAGGPQTSGPFVELQDYTGELDGRSVLVDAIEWREVITFAPTEPPTAVPTSSATRTPTRTATRTPTRTSTPLPSQTVAATRAATAARTRTPTKTATLTFRHRIHLPLAVRSHDPRVAVPTPRDLRPPVPTNFRGAAVDARSIRISWDDTPNETSYFLLCHLCPGDLPADTVTFLVTGLEPESTYYVKLTARNQYGESSTETISVRTTAEPHEPPPIPRNLAGVALDSNRIRITWDDTTDETGYFLLCHRCAGDLPANTESYTVEGLDPNSPYYIRLKAWNAFGESWTDTIVVRTP